MNGADYDSPQEAKDAAKAEGEVVYWLGEIEKALKRDKKFRETGTRVTAIYEAEKKTANQFNIVYSNTETLLPALYNNLPRPVVERRFKDEDPLGKIASDVTQRLLAYFLQNDNREYAPFHNLISQAVLESLLPGRGLTRFKYDATIEESEPAEGETPSEKVSYETVCGEELSWDNVLFGYAKTWEKTPWSAIEHFMAKDELEDNFGKELAKEIKLTAKGMTADSDSDATADEALPDLAQVWEIWDKRSKKVVFVSPGYKDAVLKKVDDPLQLSGFFPHPKPLQLTPKITDGCPVALYLMYEEQADELNHISRRINVIVKALKVRGFYNGTLGDLEKVLEADDNTLIPTDKMGIGAQDVTNLNNEIWLMPLEKLITVLQQLYQQREAIKQVIYEITGISDILRGASVASETATAQNIKNQWGTLRLKRGQKEVMRYVRDCLRIIAEIAVTKLSPETISKMTGLKYPTAAEKAQAQQLAQQIQQQSMIMAQQQSPMGGGMAAPQQPQLPPQIQQVLGSPTWEDILALLKDDLTRDYRIDIETNSTVDADATEDKANMSEFMNALAQFMNGVGPMVQEGIFPFEAAKAMLLEITRRFRFGVEVEDILKTMQAPQPKGPDPKDQAAQAQSQADTAKMGMEMKMAEAEHEMRMQEMQAEQQVKQQELALKQQELSLKAEEMQRKSEYAAQAHHQKMQQLAMKAMTDGKGKE